jgi:AcrR family transcriptional regulator
MPRQTKEELDDEIIDCAATLFARHGFKETSVQRIADAVGYSKTGLLHRYPSKEALQQAVLDRCVGEMRQISVVVGDRPAGPARDRAVVEALVELTLRRPGFVALLLSIVSTFDPAEIPPHLDAVGEALFAAFAVADPDADVARTVRVVGALGALAVAAVACHDQPAADVRSLLAAVSFDALGHPRAGAN